MTGYVTNIEKATMENEFFRKVLFTARNSQLVVMTLQPSEDIGMETHPENDQFIRIEAGEGKAILDNKEYEIKENSAIVIPAGTRHNIINTSKSEKMKLYTVYSPSNHPVGTIHKTKSDADAAEAAEHAHA
ncbi:MAG: cupin domain-containing protein [Candidatus Aenigmatarchaeota archaeon]